MKFQNYTLLVAGILLSLFLFGCGGAEDGDLTPPNFTFDGGVPTVTANPGPHTFSGTTDPGSEVDVTVNFPTTDPVPTVTTPVVQPDGSWSFDVSGLIEGSNIFAIDVSDPIGNSTVYYVTMVLDLTGPVVTLNQYATPTASTTQTLAGTVAELDAAVEVSTDGGGSWLPVVLPAGDVNGGVWIYDVTLSVGTNDVWVRGVDNLGNAPDPADLDDASLIVKQQIVVDVAAPVMTITDPIAFPYYLPDPANSGVTTLEGTLSWASYDLIPSTSPATTWVLDKADPLGVDTWALDFDALPSGVTVVSFSIQDSVPIEVAQANVMVVRDLSSPLLINTIPVHGDTGVSILTDLILTFSETMDATTVTNEMIVLTDDQGIAVPFTITPPSAGSLDRVFTFTPDMTLTASTKYSVSIVNPVAQAATDFYGNSFVPPTSLLKFTTAP